MPKSARPKPPAADPRFARVIAIFAEDPQVAVGGKGFGASALKVRGKIFAMMSSRGQFVVKLPKERVSELVKQGKGEPFDPGHGRLMREWLAVDAAPAGWGALAREARQFVASPAAATRAKVP